ncbi:MAG: histidine triad nucleotide-binding protein [Anaerolineae bacterium]|nr:histidine triad nucleotide-binding protein [Anaerolineae bacterium]
METCAFCRIAAGEESARIAYQDEDVTAFHDRNPQAPTHVLIIPNEHIESIKDVAAEDARLLGKLFVVARRIAQEEGLTAGYRLVVNTGAQAGQSVHHLHMHLLGGRPMSWPPG